MTMQERNALIEANIHLVKWQASRYKQVAREQGVEWDVLVQEGSLGLIKAAAVFDAKRGAFSSIAVPYIQGELRKCLGLSREKRNLEKLSQGALALLHKHGVAALDAPLKPDDAGSLYEYLGCSEDDLSGVYVEEYLASLKERDRKIVQMRMGGQSQRQIGETLGISQVHISRHLIALRKSVMR